MVTCDFEQCQAIAKYGVKQLKLSRCKEHKEKGMVTQSPRYCKHNKRKDQCTECGDKSSIIKCNFDGCSKPSEYGVKQLKLSRCKEHKETGMVMEPNRYCKHDKRKRDCRKCEGASFCIHDKRRTRCKECGGSQICEHGRQRCHCRECKGSQFCEHGRRRNVCKDCNGSQICEHNLQRSICVKCKGSAICKHEIQRKQCWQCNPDSNYFCVRRYDNGTRCPKKKQSKYKNHCTTCFVELFPTDPLSKIAHLASKELRTLKYLTETFPGVFIHNRRLLISDRDDSCTPHNRRIDFQTKIDSYVLCVEVDENQHKRYDPLDEEKRIMEIYENADRKMIFIRFNPDSYKEDGKLKRTLLDKRFIILKDKINEVINRIKHGDGYDNWLTEIKMFYDLPKGAQTQSVYDCATSKIIKKEKSIIHCSGTTRKKERCKNKVRSEGDFCRVHPISK